MISRAGGLAQLLGRTGGFHQTDPHAKKRKPTRETHGAAPHGNMEKRAGAIGEGAQAGGAKKKGLNAWRSERERLK